MEGTGERGFTWASWEVLLSPGLMSSLSQVWTCLIAHGATLLVHSSHQHFLYGLLEE